MISRGGGVVRYVGIAWGPSPERPAIFGECSGGGALHVLQGGRVVETFDVTLGDDLLVADGAVIAPDTPVLAAAGLYLHLRAPLADGVEGRARWSEAPVGRLDDVTGLTHLGFRRHGEDVWVDLVDAGRLLRRVFVPRGATPVVAEGAQVRRGDLLARALAERLDDYGIGDIDALRSMLNGRPFGLGGPSVAVAPFDGRVEAIAPKHIVVRAETGAVLRIRRRTRRRAVEVRVGDEVGAGDALEAGQRSPHALLRAWGEERFAAHLVDALETEAARRALSTPRVYWALLVRRMLAWRRVLSPGDTALRRHQVLSGSAFDRAVRDTVAQGGAPATAAPVLRGLAAMARALSPQNTASSRSRAS